MKRPKVPTPDMESILPILIEKWRRIHKESGPKDCLQTREFRRVVAHILENQKNGSFFLNKDTFGAYLLYTWVLHYQEGLSLIGEIPQPPKRVLDISAGSAPFSLAALKHGAKEVIATDTHLQALETGAEFCGRLGFPLTIRQWDPLTSTPPPFTGTFDLIIVGHQLFNLLKSTDPLSLIHKLMGYLSVDGHLLLVESSLPEANKRFLTLRDLFAKANIPIQAPCIFQGACPALKSQSVCFAQREFEKPPFIKELQRAAKINLSSLKMSYLLLKHKDAALPSLPEKRLYRVISPPVEGYAGKRYYLCGQDGKKLLGSHFPIPPKEAKAFEFLRRGELISVENSLETKIGLDIINGTRITIEAALGKPVTHERKA